MNKYKELHDKQEKKVHAFISQYCFFAFSKDQFAKGLAKFGIQEDEAPERFARIPGGGFILRERSGEFAQLLEEQAQELQAAYSDPVTGPEFAYDMFYYELNNHEYGYTGDTWETLESLCLTWEEVQANDILREALQKATKAARQDFILHNQ